jgi:hypothetical protein
MSQWLPGVVNGWTVGAGHFNTLEAPEHAFSFRSRTPRSLRT